MNKRNFVTGFVVLAFFILFYVCSMQLHSQAALWPQIICVVGIALSVANIALSGVKWYREERGQVQTAVFPLNAGQIKRGLILAGITIVWILAIPYVGFLVSSTLFCGVLVLIFEPQKDKKRVLRDIVVTLLFAILMYSMFTALGIHFPRGVLI